MELRQKLEFILDKLNQGLVSRENSIKLSLLTILSGENVILIGPPGTAKSLIARRLSSIIKGGSYFEYLLTKFTTPEEIFGPLSIKELEKDNFKRKTESYLPKAQIAFLDEIFKANSAILNSLLCLLNERIFHNGSVKEQTSLVSVIGASNELPDEEESELHALYDRFLTRIVLGYVDDCNFIDLLCKEEDFKDIEEKYKLTLEEIQDIKKQANSINVPQNIANLLRLIREKLHKNFATIPWAKPSDRRFKKVLHILKVSAYTNGRKDLNVLDIALLFDCLWNDPDQREQVRQIVLENLPAITRNDSQKLGRIYQEWRQEFDKLFDVGQAKNNDGDLVFIDHEGKKTTKKKISLHKKNEKGEYLYSHRYGSSSIMTYAETKEYHPHDSDYRALYEEYECQPRHRSKTV